ncbi:hypothetical protein EBX31_13410 [bacterium]|nr:hypothetical protein [bacterium]
MPARKLLRKLIIPLGACFYPWPILGENDPKNPSFEIPLMPANGWEKTSAKAWAKDLQLPLESETNYQSSYRLYATENMQFLGAVPKSIALTATEDRPEQLMIIFANKGDSAPDRLKVDAYANASFKDIVDIKRLIEADHDAVQKKLGQLFGKPTHQAFGDSGKSREFPERWDFQGTSFLLTERPGEYCALRILSTESADRGGRVDRISDTSLRERMRRNVIHRMNGDLIIENIPMLDQGPKGFCVPATYARALLYAGIPADLYLLALLGKTGAGGGTFNQDVENGIRTLASSYGRSISSVSPSLDFPKLESFFERGIPLTWAMFVDEDVNRDLTLRLRDRATNDPVAWSKILEPKRKAARKIKINPKSGHVCLLIGCNRKTGELATSDSWGPEFAERWITLEEARALSQGDLGAIIP